MLRVTDANGTAAQSSTGASGRVAGYGGLFHCGNVHVCMECSARIAAERSREIEHVLAHRIANGGWAVLITLTERHGRQHSLEQCLDAAGKAWQAVNSGKVWQADKVNLDYAGYIRALEVTESPENGWHVHYHVVVAMGSRPDRDTVDTVATAMFGRWSRALVRAGMPAPSLEHGLDVQHLEMDSVPERIEEQSREWARYLAKGIAAESALGVTKEAKGSNRTVRQLMKDALMPQRWEDPSRQELVETVDLTARAKLHEYERAMSGRKVLTWSTGRFDLRKAAELDAERSDEEIAAEDLQGEEVAVLPRETWAAMEPRATELLSVTEKQGPEGARRWLDDLGLEWWRPTGLTDQRRRGEPGWRT